MTGTTYHFTTHWRVPGTVEEVYEILWDAQDLPRWWPSVYLDVQLLNPDAEEDEEKVFSLHTRGWLPYTLRWSFSVIDPQPPHLLGLKAWGDLVGQGLWTLIQDGETVNITFDWKIQVEKPLLKRFSFILGPVFTANHRWAMRQGQKSLRLELARRQAVSPEALEIIPPPPGPATSRPIKIMGAAAVMALGLGLLGRRFRKSRQEPQQ